MALKHLRDPRNESADAWTDCITATLNFYRDTEVLQVRPDGMWLEDLKIPMSSIPMTANTSIETK